VNVYFSFIIQSQVLSLLHVCLLLSPQEQKTGSGTPHFGACLNEKQIPTNSKASFLKFKR